jgi:hypothetical protein
VANTVCKSKISIGTSSATPLTDTYSAVSGLTDIGDFGDVAEVVKVLTIDSGRPLKLKGTRDAGTFEFTVTREMTDPGQIALRAAAAADGEFNIKLEGPDKPAGAGSKPTTTYLRGLISDVTKHGDANAVISQTFSVELTLAPDTVAPVTAP